MLKFAFLAGFCNGLLFWIRDREAERAERLTRKMRGY